ncbi:MAG: helix-turn-helix transcriptional regulator [Flavobacteriales bacterium]|nr:helix-turn-helix transcriptional regulator [Flavobacteriales bacterium]
MKTQKDNIDRINKVVRYIGQNLDQNQILQDLAKLAYYSPFHFQRVFKSIVGETPKQYIKRVRLEGAAHYITLKPETSLLEVAMEYGFTSLEAFSRAFKNYYEVSPDKLRKSGEEDRLSIIQKKIISRTHLQIEPSSFLSTAINEEEFQDFEVSVVKLPPRKLVYIPITLSDMDTVVHMCMLKLNGSSKPLNNKNVVDKLLDSLYVKDW